LMGPSLRAVTVPLKTFLALIAIFFYFLG